MSNWVTEQINQIWVKVNSFKRITENDYRATITGEEKTPVSVFEGGVWNDYYIDTPTSSSSSDITVDVEQVSLSGTTATTIKGKLLEVLNSRTPVFIPRPRKYVVTTFVGYTYIKEEYSHDAGSGTFGLGEAQFLLGDNNSNITRINRVVLETESDPNNLVVATSIEQSINDGGEYLTEVRDIFTRTINGEIKTYWYNGTEDTIGGTNTDVTASDFDDITANGEDLGETTESTPIEIEDLGAAYIPLNNHEGVLINQKIAHTGDLFNIALTSLNGKADVLISTTGKTDFPKIISLLSLKIIGSNGAGNITIDGTDYGIAFNTDLETTVADFVSTHSANILANEGATVSDDSDGVIEFSSESYKEIVFANISGDLGSAVDQNKLTQLIKPIFFEADKEYKMCVRWVGHKAQYWFETILQDLSPQYTPNTGTTVVLYRGGNYCNIGSANTNSAFTFTGFGFARVEIDTTGKTDFPTVATSTLRPSVDFEADKIFDMWVDNVSGVVEYFFLAR